jgi:hypothetical protein
MQRLTDKWGSKDAWLRVVYLRANIMWVFRSQLLQLEELRWLKDILKDAFLIINVQANREGTYDDAFYRCTSLMASYIEQLIETKGLSPELEELSGLVDEAKPCNTLKEIFRPLARQTRHIYHIRHGRRVALCTEWLSSHPLPMIGGLYADPYHVNAVTDVKPQRSQIELQVFADEFEVPSLLAIPALLTHELICHAYAEEDADRVHSIWAEGVMDWAAVFFFETFSLQLGLPYASVKYHGNGLWMRRMSWTRYTGRAAADTLVEWLVREPWIHGLIMAQEVVAKFVLEINVTPAALVTKDHLASRMGLISNDPALQSAIREWHARRLAAAAILP